MHNTNIRAYQLINDTLLEKSKKGKTKALNILMTLCLGTVVIELILEPLKSCSIFNEQRVGEYRLIISYILIKR